MLSSLSSHPHLKTFPIAPDPQDLSSLAYLSPLLWTNWPNAMPSPTAYSWQLLSSDTGRTSHHLPLECLSQSLRARLMQSLFLWLSVPRRNPGKGKTKQLIWWWDSAQTSGILTLEWVWSKAWCCLEGMRSWLRSEMVGLFVSTCGELLLNFWWSLTRSTLKMMRPFPDGGRWSLLLRLAPNYLVYLMSFLFHVLYIEVCIDI